MALGGLRRWGGDGIPYPGWSCDRQLTAVSHRQLPDFDPREMILRGI